MSFYDYQCETCSEVTERQFHIGTAPEKIKNACDCGGTLWRVFRAVGLQFKGHGFHSTDYNAHGPKQ